MYIQKKNRLPKHMLERRFFLIHTDAVSMVPKTIVYPHVRIDADRNKDAVQRAVNAVKTFFL